MPYQVQKGDTIARVTGLMKTSWKNLRRLNPHAVGQSSRTGNWFLKEGAIIKGEKTFEKLLSQEKGNDRQSLTLANSDDSAQWTEYTIIARGNHLIHQVNGKTTSELFDYDEEGRALEGLLAIQLHRGNPNRVEIKELRIRELTDGEILPFDPEKTLEGAEKIERPKTRNPQGTGPIQAPKKKG